MPKSDKKQLRDYQKKGKRQVLTQFRTVDRVLYVSPTSSGKTFTAVEIARGFGRVLWVAHTKELLDQARDSLIDAGVYGGDIGCFYGGKTGQNEDARFIVASVQTLLHRDLTGFDLIVIDEAHRSAAPMYQRALESHSGKVLGLTATPTRLDGKPLDVFQVMVEGLKPSKLVEAGVIVKPRIYKSRVALVDLREYSKAGSDYHASDAGKKLSQRTILAEVYRHWSELSGGRNTVVFCCDIEHAKRVADEFCRNGTEAQVIHSKMPKADREHYLARLDDPKDSLRVIVNVDILTEGWDQPSVKCVVLCRPTMSVVRYLQMTGRIGRQFRQGGKNVTAIILDHADNCQWHGHPCADRDWDLTGTVRAVGPGRGAARMVERETGEMVEVEGEMVEFIESPLPPEIAERRAKGLPDLCEVPGCLTPLSMAPLAIRLRDTRRKRRLCHSCKSIRGNRAKTIELRKIVSAVDLCSNCSSPLGMSRSAIQSRMNRDDVARLLCRACVQTSSHVLGELSNTHTCTHCGVDLKMSKNAVRRRLAKGTSACNSCANRAIRTGRVPHNAQMVEWLGEIRTVTGWAEYLGCRSSIHNEKLVGGGSNVDAFFRLLKRRGLVPNSVARPRAA